MPKWLLAMGYGMVDKLELFSVWFRDEKVGGRKKECRVVQHTSAFFFPWNLATLSE